MTNQAVTIHIQQKSLHMYPGNHMRQLLWLLEEQDGKVISEAKKHALRNITINKNMCLSCFGPSSLSTSWINTLLVLKMFALLLLMEYRVSQRSGLHIYDILIQTQSPDMSILNSKNEYLFLSILWSFSILWLPWVKYIWAYWHLQ